MSRPVVFITLSLLTLCYSQSIYNASSPSSSNDPIVQALSAKNDDTILSAENDDTALSAEYDNANSQDYENTRNNTNDQHDSGYNADDPMGWEKIKWTFLSAFIIALGVMFLLAIFCGFLNVIASKKNIRGYVRT